MSTLALMGAGPETASSFSVLSLSPTVWYDFSTTAGGGAAITSISDLSGNGRTASQATGSKQPTSQSAVQNGRNIGRFDGTDDELLTASFAISQPFIVYAALANLTGNAGRYFSSGDGAIRVGASSAVPGHDLFAGSALGATYTAGAYNAFRQVTVIVNGASTIMRSNGVQDGTGNIGANNGTTGIALGSQNASQFWGGDYGEVFAVAGSTLSTAAENYLKARWGTP
jgi:hypothetical protein